MHLNFDNQQHWNLILPWHPGYRHRKALPRSSACFFPIGVNSPPHLTMTSKLSTSFISLGSLLLRPFNLDIVSALRSSCIALIWTLRLIPLNVPYLESRNCMLLKTLITTVGKSFSTSSEMTKCSQGRKKMGWSNVLF